MCNSKKIGIKNFKGAPVLPENYAAVEWAKLQCSVNCIQTSEKPKLHFEELYRIVENLCTYNYKNFLLENLCNMLQSYLSVVFERLYFCDTDLLSCLAAEWATFQDQIKLIKNIFLYMDCSKNSVKSTTVTCVSSNLFKSTIILNPILKIKIIDDILTDIQSERIGNIINKKLIKTLLCILMELQAYDEIFKPKFLEITSMFYEEEGKLLIKSCSVNEYLHHVNERILEEKERAINYLDISTGNKVMEVLYHFLINNHIKNILTNGLNDLLENNKLEELTLLYDLLSCVSTGLAHLEESFSAYLIKHGSSIVTNPENDKNMIQELLDFKLKIDTIVKKAFKSNDRFLNVVRNSFSQFINKRLNKPAELLAKYVDSKMRCKSLMEDEIEAILQRIMVIFRLVQGKDIFEAFYKGNLAKRLLLGKSTSQDVEKSMLSKLKEECGSNYTAKLEGMFKDVSISGNINATFRQHLNHLQNSGDGRNVVVNKADFCINVLTSSYWPTYKSYDINLPAELIKTQQIFQRFYVTNHSGRKLLWQPSLGHCIVKAQFNNDVKKELQVSLFQTTVLLLFNENDKLSYSEIKEHINLEEIELKRTLLSLACGKCRVLMKNSRGVDIQDSDEFSFNGDFTDKLFRVKINQVQLKETAEEQKATEESVLLDRQFQIDAAVVRIMKQHKTLHHNVLMAQLYDVLDVPVNPASLKKRIELLIERDYIERDKDNGSCYKYVA